MNIEEKANELKNAAYEAGVEEWFFDAITDENLIEYTLDDIIEMWNESQ
jgi:hypothetical protein